MTGLDAGQFRRLIVKPTLDDLGMWSAAAENLLVGTALVESGLKFMVQLGGGPALGLFQMEPATAMDITARYLAERRDLSARLTLCAGPSNDGDWALASEGEIRRRLVSDLRFACALARLKYWMDPVPLPDEGDLRGLAGAWKRVYNTADGAGQVEKFIARYA